MGHKVGEYEKKTNDSIMGQGAKIKKWKGTRICKFQEAEG